MPGFEPTVTDDTPAPPSAPLPESESRDFRCGECSATMTWDPDAGALACAFCGGTEAVDSGERVIVEYALDDVGSAARGLGLEMRASRCDNCGATVAFDEAATAQLCVFCGSSSVLEQEARRNAIRPESLVPLDVGRADVEKAFRKWTRGLWFRPNALKRLERFDAVGVYLPFWTFDCGVRSDWTAQAGYHYWESETYWEDGKMKSRQVQKTRWEFAAGARDDAFDDLLVLASTGVDAGLVARLGGFNTNGLVAYRPEYLAGWAAEEYRVDLQEAWGQGQERVVAIQEGRCSGDVPGDTQRVLLVRNRIRDVRWKHVLLPLWSLTYELGGETYPVLVNGQNGRVVGKAPVSWVKILLLVLVIAALIAGGVRVSRYA